MFRILVFIALLIASPPAAAEKTHYSEIISDLPLMQEMVEDPAAAVVFDTPSGRILQTLVSARGLSWDVLAFYDRVLPPLGWEKTGPARYLRDNEILAIALEGDRFVRFSLSPQGE